MEEEFDFEEEKQEFEGIDSERHWKSLSIASAVISVICILIIISIIIITPAKNDDNDLQPYSLDDVINRQMIKGHHFNGSWISDHEFIYQSADQNIILYDYWNGTHRALTTKLNTTDQRVVAFQLSQTRTFLLFTTKDAAAKKPDHIIEDVEQNALKYFAYDLRNGNILNLQEELCAQIGRKTVEQQKSNDKDAAPRKVNTFGAKDTGLMAKCAIQSAQWTPRGNELILAAENDIYRLRMDSQSQTGVGRRVAERLTDDGSIEAGIFNAINDPIYRDFIFTRSMMSLWWSPITYRYMAFIKFNNSEIPVAKLAAYPDGSDGIESTRYFRYPTIESPIGRATLHVIDFADKLSRSGGRNIKSIIPPHKMDTSEHYITHVDWKPNDQLLVIWTFRAQRDSIMTLCEPDSSKNWRCKELTTLTNRLPLKQIPGSILPMIEHRALPPQSGIQPSSDVSEYIICCQTPENGDNALHQLYSLNIDTKSITSYLNLDTVSDDAPFHKVWQLVAYNAALGVVFFEGQSLSRESGETALSEQDMRPAIFALSLRTRTVQCLTCRLTTCHQQMSAAKIDDPTRPPFVCLDINNASRSSSVDNDLDSCLFRAAHFAPGARYALIVCIVGIVPRVYSIEFRAHLDTYTDTSTTTTTADIIQNVTLFEDNAELEQRIAGKMIPNVESFVISREHGAALKYLRIKILTPHDFSNQHFAKYPMIFQFAPASLSQKVTASFAASGSEDEYGDRQVDSYPNIEWAIHMVTEHRCVYAWLDGYFSEDGHKQWSSEDSLDQLIDDHFAMIDFVQSNMTFVDLARTCLIGTNVGASLVMLALAAAGASTTGTGSMIDCGIAIAPIVQWHSVNTLIAEQYLEWDRFAENDLPYMLKINFNYSALANKRILLMHGTANQLVPFSHTIQLLKSLSIEQLRNYWRRSNVADVNDTTTTIAQIVEPLVNSANSFEILAEYFYRKIEFFLFKFVIVE